MLVGAALAGAGLVAACSGPAPARPADATGGGTLGEPPAATQSVAPPTAGATSAETGQAAPPAGGNSADCTIDHLKVTARAGDAGSGHRSEVLVFTNTGPTVCRLFGYPGVAALNGAGAQIEQAVRTASGYLGGVGAGHSAQAASLSPGESAAAIVEASAFNTSNGTACTAYAGLLVTPPNETRSTKVAWDNDGCSGLQIHPVVLGTTGQDT